MQFPIMIRGFSPRPWKTKGGSQVYAGTFVVLDMSERPVMDTMRLEREFADEAEMVKAAQLVGKQAVCIVEGLRTGVDGEPHLKGKIEQAKP